MPRTIDGGTEWTAASGPRPGPRDSGRLSLETAPRFRLSRPKPIAGSPDSAAAPMAESRRRFVDPGSSERWFYFATAVLFIAIIATFGTLIWQIARAFR